MFADSKNKQRGKEFITFLLQDENLIPYVEGVARPLVPGDEVGRGKAVVLARRSASDVGAAAVRAPGTVPFEFTKNYKFTILNNENVWAKAMNRVVSEKWPVEKAVDEMIARIKAVAG